MPVFAPTTPPMMLPVPVTAFLAWQRAVILPVPAWDIQDCLIFYGNITVDSYAAVHPLQKQRGVSSSNAIISSTRASAKNDIASTGLIDPYEMVQPPPLRYSKNRQRCGRYTLWFSHSEGLETLRPARCTPRAIVRGVQNKSPQGFPVSLYRTVFRFQNNSAI